MAPHRHKGGQYAAEQSHIEDRSRPRLGGPVRCPGGWRGARSAGEPERRCDSKARLLRREASHRQHVRGAGSEALLKNNPNINTIYASNDLDEEQDFLSVIDAIQGEGFNPLWHQVLIVFNRGFTPHQFVSEDQVLAAAAGAHPEITLVSTDEVYRCSIVRSK